MARSQTTVEYVILIGILVAALVVISAYISRGFQGQLRTQADQVGEQYSPTHMKTDIVQFYNIHLKEDVVKKVSESQTDTTMRTYRSDDGTKPGYENIKNLSDEIE